MVTSTATAALGGPCEKADNEGLWRSFKAAQDAFYQAAQRDHDQRQREARARAQERVTRLEQQLANVESAIFRA